MMTSEQRYFFDTTGYLHLPSALDSTELAAAQAAVQRYIDTPPEKLPPGFVCAGRQPTGRGARPEVDGTEWSGLQPQSQQS